MLAGRARPAYWLYHTFWSALDWVYPPACGGCEVLGERWCGDCASRIFRLAGSLCAACGDPLTSEQATSGLCQDCQAKPPAYQALRSAAAYRGPLRAAVHRMKYQRDIGLGEALSNYLTELYNDLKWDIDVVTAVPLSPKRLRERGYNQAGLLARPLSYAICKPYRPNLLIRSRETRSQVGLSARERQANVSGAFQARSELVRGKMVLIIDDVTTTGATIGACAQALHLAGASAVFGLTLARAMLQADADTLPKTSLTNGGTNGS